MDGIGWESSVVVVKCGERGRRLWDEPDVGISVSKGISFSQYF